MERESQFHTPPPPTSAGKQPYAPSEVSFGDAYINGVYDGLSFHSLLTYDPYASSAPPLAPYAVLDLAARSSNVLATPKSEPESHHTGIFTFNEAISMKAPPYNFFSDAASSSHHHLPGLLSLEPPRNAAVKSLPRSENLRRQRKQHRLSDKTRSLQKLLPWDKKMDIATILEEAYKYIKFLQAQVSILQSMPNLDGGNHGAASSLSYGSQNHAVVGDHLGRLNRQQLLQVLLHSPNAQTVLYSNGCCVYSLEQLLLLNNNAERKLMLFDSNACPWGPDCYGF